MSDAARTTPNHEPVIDAEDEVWLAERLHEYRELLIYLQEH